MSGGGAGLDNSRRATVRVFWALFLATVVLAMIGMQYPALRPDGRPVCVRTDVWGATDYVYRFLLMLHIGGEGIETRKCFDHWAPEITRFTGPGAVFAGLVVLTWDFLASPRRWWRRVGLRGHTIVVGLGQRGAALARASRRVLAIDLAPPADAPANAVLVQGDGTDAEVLDKARIGRAAALFAATGDPLVNLRVARLARERGVADVYALASDPLIRRGLDAHPDAALNVVALEELAARQLCAAARFHELADLMGQPRMHVAMLGEGRALEAILAQILRASLVRPDERPAFTLVSADGARARAGLLRSYPGIERAADLEFLDIELAQDPLTGGSPLLAGLRRAGPLTAMVVAQADVAANYPAAAAVRAAQRRGEAPACPIFFGAWESGDVSDLAAPLEETPRLSDVLHPFELGAGACTPEAILQIDALAQALHRGFLATHQELTQQGLRPSAAQESLAPWPKLPATYRQANRRSADHAAAKLYALGTHVPAKTFWVRDAAALLGDGGLERLSRLEHAAWMVDRLLEGWRYGRRRDDRARVHNCLVPYDELPEETRELDRAEVRQLLAAYSRPANVMRVRFDLWIGLIGALELSLEDAEWLRAQTAKAVSAAYAADPERHVTLVTCLAPGADVVMTQAALQALREHGAAHRLLVVEALSPAEMVADFEPRWAKGARTGLLGAESETAWTDVAKTFVAAREALIARSPCARVADLDAASGETPYQTQNRYLVSRSDLFIAAVRKGRTRKPGGTAEALAWRSGAPGMGPPFPGIPHPPVEGLPRTLLLDLNRREVAAS